MVYLVDILFRFFGVFLRKFVCMEIHGKQCFKKLMSVVKGKPGDVFDLTHSLPHRVGMNIEVFGSFIDITQVE